MKADITRDTYRKEKHYDRVTMQQGRIQVDADWNEQADIHIHRSTTSTRHIVGRTGAPKEAPGFKIQLRSDNKNPPYDYYYTIGGGYYYVDGIICENETQIDATNQPDLPMIMFSWNEILSNQNEIRRLINFLEGTFSEIGHHYSKTIETTPINGQQTIKVTDPSSGYYFSLSLNTYDPSKASSAVLKIQNDQIPICNFIVVKDVHDDKKILIGYNPAMVIPKQDTLSLVYLDVWKREITWLDDPYIKEFSLGGLDTATRTKIVWQVKAIPVGTLKEEDSNKQHEDKELRQEVQQKGSKKDETQTQYQRKTISYDGTNANYCSCYSNFLEWTELVGASSGTLRARLKPASTPNDQCTLPQQSAYRGTQNQLYRVEIHDKDTFKWSRDNGVVVSTVKDIFDTENKIVLKNIGKDNSKFGYRSEYWIEVTDDRHELWGIPGTLVPVSRVEGDTIYFTPEKIKGEPITAGNFPKEHNPKVRGWDSIGTIRLERHNGESSYIDLENDIQVAFGKQKEEEDVSSGHILFRTGDYWLIPARLSSSSNNMYDLRGRIEWPEDVDGEPLALPPQGIEHNLCKLALISSNSPVKDCRQFFLPLNHLTLHYVSGDGQEGSIDEVLPVELSACVRSGDVPIEGVTVMFEIITKGSGALSGGRNSSNGKYYAISNKNGFVSCKWKLGDDKNHHHQVRAVIVEQIHGSSEDHKVAINGNNNNNNNILVDLPIYFNATVINSQRELNNSPITEELVIDFTKEEDPKTTVGELEPIDWNNEIVIAKVPYRSATQKELIPSLILVGFVSNHGKVNGESRTPGRSPPKYSPVLFIEEGVLPASISESRAGSTRSRSKKGLSCRAINISGDTFDIKIEGEQLSLLQGKVVTLRWWAVPCEVKK